MYPMWSNGRAMTEEKPLRLRTYKQRPKDEVWIYGLIHPVSKEVRYVGQTCRSIEYRVYEHIRSAKKGGEWPVTRWIRKLLDKGLIPVAIQLEHVPPYGNWQEAEERWIAHYKQLLGKRSLNVTTGGEGTRGYRHSPERREAISRLAKQQGRKPPGNKGRIFGPKARANMSAGHKGKPGTPWTDEQRAKHKATIAKNPYVWSEETRIKTMRARKNYKINDSHRKSLSEAAKKAWLVFKTEGYKTSEEERITQREARKARRSRLKTEADHAKQGE